MDEHLENMLKRLGLRNLLAHWDHYMDIAKKGDSSFVRLLTDIIEQ